jgi:hypothetical protein
MDVATDRRLLAAHGEVWVSNQWWRAGVQGSPIGDGWRRAGKRGSPSGAQEPGEAGLAARRRRCACARAPWGEAVRRGN